MKDKLISLAEEGKYFEACIIAGKYIKQLEKQKSFLISCVKSGEQLSDDWEKKLEEK